VHQHQTRAITLTSRVESRERPLFAHPLHTCTKMDRWRTRQ
jgi:hypothetical protein